MRTILCLLSLTTSTFIFAQEAGRPYHAPHPHQFMLNEMPDVLDELPPSFFACNREALLDTLPDSSVVVIFSASEKNRSNDIQFPFHQDPDFYYLTGLNEPNAALALFKPAIMYDGRPISEVLFIEEKNPKKETWTGTMLGVEGAVEALMIDPVLSNEVFKTFDFGMENAVHVYSNSIVGPETDNLDDPGDLASLTSHFDRKAEKSEKKVERHFLEELMAFFRQAKKEEELVMMRQAIGITCDALTTLMEHIGPRMTEYQAEALVEYIFRANGAEGAAFPSVVASGSNGGIMHYTQNDRMMTKGDMVIVDIGAQYEHYAADVTRTIPVSGKFSEEQAQVYQVVLDAQTVAIRYAVAGNKFWIPHEEAYRTIGRGLIKLGVIKEWAEIQNYFIHGTSHYLGLDVHDTGLYGALKPGQVITVEPGVYIPEGSPCDPKWWNIYVRIEDDILITEAEAEVLSDCVPKKIVEIEAFMNKDQALGSE